MLSVAGGASLAAALARTENAVAADEPAMKSRLPALDARDFPGIDLTGAPGNSTAGLQAAIDQAVAEKRALYIPAGTLRVTGVTLRPGTRIFGAPGFKTRLILPTLSTRGAIMGTGTANVSADDVVLEDLFLDGQQQERAVACGHALLKAYKAKRWTLRRLMIANGTNYGLGWQGYPGNPEPEKQDVPVDLLIEQCYFADCGHIGGTVGVPRSGTTNSSDNIDIKSSDRIVLVKVHSSGSSDPCYDIRARRADLIGCVAENGRVGFELDAHRPNVSIGYPDNDSYMTLTGCTSRNNTSVGFAVSSTTGQSDTYVDLIGCQATGNGADGYSNNAPAAGGTIAVSIVGGKYMRNARHGVNVNDVRNLTVTGAVIRENGSRGILCTNQPGGVITGNILRSNGREAVQSVGTSDDLIVTNNDVRNINPGYQPLVLVGNRNLAHPNLRDANASSIPVVPSAPSITLPTHSDFVTLSGTAAVENIAASYANRRVTIFFASTARHRHRQSPPRERWHEWHRERHHHPCLHGNERQVARSWSKRRQRMTYADRAVCLPQLPNSVSMPVVTSLGSMRQSATIAAARS